MRSWARWVVHCGRHSLHIFCPGTILSLTALVAMIELGSGLGMQILLNASGLARMGLIACRKAQAQATTAGQGDAARATAQLLAPDPFHPSDMTYGYLAEQLAVSIEDGRRRQAERGAGLGRPLTGDWARKGGAGRREAHSQGMPMDSSCYGVSGAS